MAEGSAMWRCRDLLKSEVLEYGRSGAFYDGFRSVVCSWLAEPNQENNLFSHMESSNTQEDTNVAIIQRVKISRPKIVNTIVEGKNKVKDQAIPNFDTYCNINSQ